MFGRSTILVFHQISNRLIPGINNIRPDNFLALLDLINSLGFTFWNGDSFSEESDTSRQVVITFDDGYRDQYDLFIRLRRDGIKPVVFVPTAYIGKTNRWEYSSRLFPCRHLDAGQIEKLANSGVLIGSHGASHRSLVRMSEEQLQRELESSKRILGEITGQQIDLISFPFGRTSSHINASASKCGYRHGFILQPESSIVEADNFVLSRVPIYSIDDFYSVRASLIKNTKLEWTRRRIINGLSGGTIIISRRLK